MPPRPDLAAAPHTAGTAAATVELGPLALELGGQLPAVRVAHESWGRPRRDAAGQVTNAVLVLHALTGDAHVAGPAGPGQPTPGWWDGLVGPGRALDTERWFVLAANVLGGCRGTTGPGDPAPDGVRFGARFPRVTIRDQVRVEGALADALGIARFAAVLGGSMGGMRALEWPLLHPDRVDAALVLAVGAAATADQIGTQSTQIAAVRADPVHGLGLARRIAHLSYRSEAELEQRFGRRPQAGEDPFAATGAGRFAVQSYLDHQAAKLEARFDPDSYVVLTDAMNTHDVGRGRGGVDAALRSIAVPVVVGGIDTDRLYPLHLQQRIADLVPRADGLHVVRSPYGHDGFLIETGAVGALVRRTLELAEAERARRDARPAAG